MEGLDFLGVAIVGADWDRAPSVDDVFAGKASIRKGMEGLAVSYVQRALGIREDGKFGVETEAAVKAFQAKSLPDQFANGVVGDVTFKAIMTAKRVTYDRTAPQSAPQSADATSQSAPQSADATSQSAEAKKKNTYLIAAGAAALLIGAALFVFGGKR